MADFREKAEIFFFAEKCFLIRKVRDNRRYKKQQLIYFISFARSFVNTAHIFKLYD